MLFGFLLVFGSFAPMALGQEAAPEIIPAERKTPRKKDNGPRAVGLIQMGANGKSSIIPIAILINGKFWDASAYKADPVPMALESGTVYEGERSGSSLGLFTVGSALHSNNPEAAIPWLGTGVWRAAGTEPVKHQKAEAAPVGIESTDGPPRLKRSIGTTSSSTPGSSTASGSGQAPAGSSTAPASSGSSTSSSPPASGSGDEPPRLKKGIPEPDSSPAQSAPSGSTTSESSKPNDTKGDPTKSADAKSGDKPDQGKDAKTNIATSDSGASEANRPRLRRGKPAESFADEDIPGYSLPGVRRTSAASSGKVVEAVAARTEDVRLIPAISDEGGPIPHSFAFEWIPGEEADRRKQMVELAKDEVRTYVAARTKNDAETTTEHKAAAKRVSAPKVGDPILENMQMVSYDLWNSNQPVLILSAQAHMPAATGFTSQPEDAALQYSVMLVAYPDIYHNLHKLYAGVTDKYHLDMTPRLDLIDAVDADGDGYGELLFRETSDIGTGWVLYRATADKLWKMFDSLSPE